MADERSGKVSSWWVNQGKSYAAERDGGYVWAPQHARNGAVYGHHAAVQTLHAGELIVHYANGAIRAIGRAATDGYEAERPPELPGEAWEAAGFRADVEYHPLDEPLRLNELDARLRADAGGPFNSQGGVNQGYLYPLPDSIRSHLVTSHAERLPIPLASSTDKARLVAVYVGQNSVSNFHFSFEDGRWGWKTNREGYSQISTGDLIAFATGYTGGSPRVQPEKFAEHAISRLVLGRVTSPVVSDRAPYWPDEDADTSYPYRLSWEPTEESANVPIAELDARFGGEVADGFRRSAISQGQGVIVTISDGSQGSEATTLAGLDEITAAFTASVREAGLRYPDELVRVFLTSLATKRFLILTGLSGSGKTRIAQEFGYWLGARQHLIVAVRPDWTSPDALLGYENGLSELDGNGHHAWSVPQALQFMLRASADPNRPYLLVLDEMNLAHVERYFADVLSGMESGHPVLPNLAQTDDGWRIADPSHSRLPLPENLFVVGTVNVDETTYMFSPKVLDRANTIEFRVGSDDLLAGAAEPGPIEPGPAQLQRSFLEHARRASERSDGASQIAGWLRNLHQLLAQHDREFGHRVFQEALRFADLFVAAGEPDPVAALDVQVLQKVLPKLHGSIREINDPLNALGAWAFHGPDTPSPGEFDPLEPPEGEAALPRSFEKICRMTRRLRANHFVSFTE